MSISIRCLLIVVRDRRDISGYFGGSYCGISALMYIHPCPAQSISGHIKRVLRRLVISPIHRILINIYTLHSASRSHMRTMNLLLSGLGNQLFPFILNHRWSQFRQRNMYSPTRNIIHPHLIQSLRCQRLQERHTSINTTSHQHQSPTIAPYTATSLTS